MSSRRHRGVSLIELVVFVVVLGIGMAGMAVLYNQLTRASVDPVVRKQALAIAASLLEEIELHPFTYCDPDDPLVFTETSESGCSSAAMRESGTIGPEAGETRYASPRYDNVSDYNGLSLSPTILDINGAAVAGLSGYTATVSIVNAGLELPSVASNTAALRIRVTVNGPAGVSISLQGYRVRYAPNSP